AGAAVTLRGLAGAVAALLALAVDLARAGRGRTLGGATPLVPGRCRGDCGGGGRGRLLGRAGTFLGLANAALVLLDLAAGGFLALALLALLRLDLGPAALALLGALAFLLGALLGLHG